jgi:flagellar basal body-associated protein FliL
MDVPLKTHEKILLLIIILIFICAFALYMVWNWYATDLSKEKDKED